MSSANAASPESDTLPPEPTSPSAQSPTSGNPAGRSQRPQSQWLFWALSSGAFAACNGVFAKLTTTSQTVGLATSISHGFGFSEESRFIEFAIRAIFFGFNLLSNAIMWILFTRALTAANSTTRVSILNTSSNFMVTALLSWLVFSERLPFGWWAGATLLVAGSVVIGAREGGDAEQSQEGTGAVALETSTDISGGDPQDERRPEDGNQHNRYTDEDGQEEEDRKEGQPSHDGIK